jgi:hypothetical protein
MPPAGWTTHHASDSLSQLEEAPVHSQGSKQHCNRENNRMILKEDRDQEARAPNSKQLLVETTFHFTLQISTNNIATGMVTVANTLSIHLKYVSVYS